MKRFRLQANYKIMAARLHYEIYALTQRLRLTTIRAEHEQAVSEILAKLKQVLAKSNRILAKLKQDLVTLVSTKISKSTEYNLLFQVGSL